MDLLKGHNDSGGSGKPNGFGTESELQPNGFGIASELQPNGFGIASEVQPNGFGTESEVQPNGFTMIEVIAVLVILGVLAAVAISRATDTSPYSLLSETAILKNDLRFAQIKALGDVPPDTWGIDIGRTSFTLVYNGAAAPINLPGDNSPTHAFSGGVTATPADITFDTWGNPGVTNSTVTLTSGPRTATVTVTRNTGLVQ